MGQKLPHNTPDSPLHTVSSSPRESSHLSWPLSYYCLPKVEKSVFGLMLYQKGGNGRLPERVVVSGNIIAGSSPLHHFTDKQLPSGLCRLMCLWPWPDISDACCPRTGVYEARHPRARGGWEHSWNHRPCPHPGCLHISQVFYSEVGVDKSVQEQSQSVQHSQDTLSTVSMSPPADPTEAHWGWLSSDVQGDFWFSLGALSCV